MIRMNSLAGVFKNKQWSKVSQMGPGLAINYAQGITDYVDFTASMGASIVDYTFKNKPNTWALITSCLKQTQTLLSNY